MDDVWLIDMSCEWVNEWIESLNLISNVHSKLLGSFNINLVKAFVFDRAFVVEAFVGIVTSAVHEYRNAN